MRHLQRQAPVTLRAALLAVLAGLWITCAAAHAASEHAVKVISPQRLALDGGELSIGLSQDWNRPLPDIQRALVIVHGRLRNAQTYLGSAEQAAARAGQASSTLVIAPQFLNQLDTARHHLPDTLLRWHANDWMAGETALGPTPLSSYAVLDAILQRLSDRRRFPGLKEIVIAGHSGGAQVVQRYALLGHWKPPPGLRLHYVIANPSSYAWLDARRPAPGFEPATCPGFNTWKYGLEQLPAYAGGKNPAALEKTYAQRAITYLLGQDDIDPHHPALDKSCAAEAQGAYRLIRGHNFFDTLRQRHGQGLAQHLVEVPGVGHNGAKMFTSPEGQAALFGR